MTYTPAQRNPITVTQVTFSELRSSYLQNLLAIYSPGDPRYISPSVVTAPSYETPHREPRHNEKLLIFASRKEFSVLIPGKSRALSRERGTISRTRKLRLKERGTRGRARFRTRETCFGEA